MIPKPTATKNDAKTSTPTSRGNSASGLENLFAPELSFNYINKIVQQLDNSLQIGKFTA